MEFPRFRLLVISLLAAGSVSIGTTAAARAGTYGVAACHLSGFVVGIDGWSAASDEVHGTRTYNRCATLGYFGGAVVTSKAAPAGASATWTFTAPAATYISGYSLFRYATSEGGSSWTKGYVLYEEAMTNAVADAIDSCLYSRGCTFRGRSDSWYAPDNHVVRPSVHLHRVILASECFASTYCPATNRSYSAQTVLYGAYMTLRDDHKPALTSEPGGGLFKDDTTIRGDTSVSWAAQDSGGGLNTVDLTIDGRSQALVKADPSDPNCANLTTQTVPCPLEANGSFDYDTARLPDGTHHAQLVVTDISGNKTYSRSVRFMSANHPVPNGIAPTRSANLKAVFAHNRRAALIGYGRRKRIYGRLTRKDGNPIPGADVRIYGRQQRTGAKSKLMKRVRTTSTGRFAWTPPAGPSRTYTAAYRAYSTDLKDAARATLSLGVKAGVTLKLTPRTLRNGHKMAIRGTLRGRANRSGTIVTMQVLNPRKVSFMSLRVDRHGRFKGSYRFRNTHVRYRFRFRSVVLRQAAYPYRTGTSRTAAVTVLP